MRPAVIASVARNRKAGAQRIRLLTPQFSGRKFIVMIFVGTLVFAPGVALTILGISDENHIGDSTPAHNVLYKVIGPAACGVGVCILVAAVLYYCCYGTSNAPARPRSHSSTGGSGNHHRQSSHSSSHSNQQDALIEDEKHRHKHHRQHHRRSHDDAKKSSNKDEVC